MWEYFESIALEPNVFLCQFSKISDQNVSMFEFQIVDPFFVWIEAIMRW